MTPIAPIPFLFDHPIHSSHKWYGALHVDDLRDKPQEKAVRSNLAIDGRINSSVESQLLSEFSTTPYMPVPITSILESAPNYFRQKYCRPYIDVKFLSDVVTVPPRRELLHVGSLRNLISRTIKDARGRSILTDHFKTSYGRSLIPISGDLPWGEIALTMNRGSTDKFRQTVGLIHRQLGPNQPFWWASFFAEVKTFADDATKLVNNLGLGEFEDDQLLLTYRYLAGDVGLLYRPTTIEANNYAFHFPSPTNTPTGFTMALAAGFQPCSEVIHHCPNAARAEIFVDGRVLELNAGKLLAAQYDNVESCRAMHRAYLRREQANRNPAAARWLDRHSCRF